ncbi:MAG: RNA-binding transcriptional accessory protein, partial [Erysipelotrichaceae bacterium]|nr:RNA-binding transcriptional accessory protein [Erysipelotrichaceae bacterium]
MDTITSILAQELNKPAELVGNVIALLDEGNTIPFIARYRKEAHGAMDDTTLRELEDRLKYLRNLQARREEVLRLIEETGKLTPALADSIKKAQTLAEVEDLYRPYKQKRKTRASAAKEKGLEPLAAALFSQKEDLPDPLELARQYVDPEKEVNTAEEALRGASDILAEVISDNPNIRKLVREYYQRNGAIVSCAAKEEDSVYSQYYDFDRAVSKLQGHQVLAINRGEKEGFLKVRLIAGRDDILQRLEGRLIRRSSKA